MSKKRREVSEEEKKLTEEILNGKSLEEYKQYLQSLSPERLESEVKKLESYMSRARELAKKENRLFSFYFELVKLFIVYDLPRLLFTLFQTFLVVEKIFDFYPFGEMPLVMILSPLWIKLCLDVVFDLIDKHSRKSK